MNLNIVNLEEFLLSHGDLSKIPVRGKESDSNDGWFRCDFVNGALDRYKGTFVAYQKCNLVGQSRDGQLLFKEAEGYYGSSNLTVFKVPEKVDFLEYSVKEAMRRGR